MSMASFPVSFQAFLPLLRQAAKSSGESGLSHQRASVFNMSSQLGSIADNTSGAFYAYRSTKVRNVRHKYIIRVISRSFSEVLTNHSRVSLYHGPVYNDIAYNITAILAEQKFYLKLTTGTPYLAPAGELWGLLREVRRKLIAFWRHTPHSSCVRQEDMEGSCDFRPSLMLYCMHHRAILVHDCLYSDTSLVPTVCKPVLYWTTISRKWIVLLHFSHSQIIKLFLCEVQCTHNYQGCVCAVDDVTYK